MWNYAGAKDLHRGRTRKEQTRTPRDKRARRRRRLAIEMLDIKKNQ